MIDETNLKKSGQKEKTDEDISLEFLEEYKKLVKKYKRDFVQGEVHIIKVEKI